jgi:hypothetical protein
MRSTFSVRLCDTLIMSNKTVGFYETRYVGHAVEYNLDAIFFDPVTITIQKRGSSNFWDACKTCISQRETVKFCMLRELRRVLIRPFLWQVRNTNMEECWKWTYVLCCTRSTLGSNPDQDTSRVSLWTGSLGLWSSSYIDINWGVMLI